jgi:DNA-binding NarL/FixJ family response regulator
MAFKILAIDHQLNTDVYLNLGQHLPSCHDLEVCNSLKDAYCILFEYKPQFFFDVVILNWQMPPFAEKNICNGAVLAKQIRTKLPNTKIIVMARFWQPSQLRDTINSCKPDGIFEKCDLCFQNIPIFVSQVLKGEIIRTPTILDYLQIYAAPQKTYNFLCEFKIGLKTLN